MFDSTAFFAELDARIARYDLLQHAYYTAWSRGELTREDLREYASEYWHHVSAFPTYLSALHSQLPDGELRRTVLANLADEEGMRDGTPHSDMWMDFARGMGAKETNVRARELAPETRALLSHFRETMYGSLPEAVAALYTYESRVPAIACMPTKSAASTPPSRYSVYSVHSFWTTYSQSGSSSSGISELNVHPSPAP